jgi:hypothetical protein
LSTYSILPVLPLFCLLPLACSSQGKPEAATTTQQALGAPLPAPFGPDCAGAQDGWPMFGQNVCNTRSAQSGDLLNPLTASRLAVKWTFDAAGDISATPAVVGGEVYVPDWGGMI